MHMHVHVHVFLFYFLKVFSWTHESLPDPRHPLDTYFDSSTGRLSSYQLVVPEDLTLNEFSKGSSPPVVLTTDVQRNAAMILPWLQQASRQPFLLVGPEGCGKELLLSYCFTGLTSTHVAIVHCSAQTSSLHVQQKLSQVIILEYMYMYMYECVLHVHLICYLHV